MVDSIDSSDAFDSQAERQGLTSYDWQLSYRTSATLINGRPVDMLRDFYIPALSRSVRYDRVAGYFRSSSLAAASQGFSTFVNRQGSMRLVVGADLEKRDVEAILAGDDHKLANCLNHELEGSCEWPRETANGVELLAWMVAHGYLEVKVAFRRHAATGEVLRLDDNVDGYVHEKWFVLHDEFDNRLYGSGTLNESKTALVLNAENVDIHCDWWGDIEYRRTQQAAEDFEKLWAGEHPCLPVFTLPEAVRQKLLKLAEGVAEPVEVNGRPAGQPIVEPTILERLQFAVIKDAPRMPGGRMVGIATAPVLAWPHQEVVAKRLINNWPFSFLLCDEVGLGKTIEAGLAIRSLYLSGLVYRILIAAPASLTQQWQREMAAKMLLPFGRARTLPALSHEYIYPYDRNIATDSIYAADLNIVSTGLIPRQNYQDSLAAARTFDITLVDEAHYARRRNPAKGTDAHPDYGKFYTTIRDRLRPKTRSLWLATATPMQIHPVEVSDLLALTNRAGAFQYDPVLAQQYYHIMGRLVQGQDIHGSEWDFLGKAVASIKIQDPFCWRYLRDNAVEPRRLRKLDQWLEHGHIPRGRDQREILPLLFSAAPLSRVMMRHNRNLLRVYREKGQLNENLAQRHVRPLQPIVFTEGERAIYNSLEVYLQGLAEQIRLNGDQASRQMISFLLSFFRLRFASSINAFRATMERRLRKVEATLGHQLLLEAQNEGGGFGLNELTEFVFESVDETDLEAVESLLYNRTAVDLEWEREYIRTMLSELESMRGQNDSKALRLLSILDERRDARSGRVRQTVIFTRFYDTLQDIVSQLQRRDARLRIGTYSGQGAAWYDSTEREMASVSREQVKEKFLAGEIDILVCTDAAAEGLNLQTADLLINYDLPWNPMKVEQRIGRIDRIGQSHQHIYVDSLCYADSAEETVYGRLLERLRQANLIVGTQQLSLLPVDPEDFAKLAENRMSLEELQNRVTITIREQQRYARSTEIAPVDLFNIYMRLKEQERNQRIPVDLDIIWGAIKGSPYLTGIGGQLHADGHVYTMPASEGQVSALTVSRSVYEKGWDDKTVDLHFASYGDTLFDTMLDRIGSYVLPKSMRRLTVPIPGIEGAEMVAYAVACRGPEESVSVRIITGYLELSNLDIAEDYTLSDAEVEPLLQKLSRIAHDEYGHIEAAGSIERENIRIGKAQEVLDYAIGRDLLMVTADTSNDNPTFWPTLRDMKTRIAEHPQLIINDLPVKVLRNYKSSILFNYSLPQLQDTVSLTVPRLMLEAAVSAMERLADGERGRRRDLPVTTMLRRMKFESDRRLRDL